MPAMVLLKEQLKVFLDRYAQRDALVAPVSEEGAVAYRRVKSAEEVTVDFDLPTLPPKAHFLPQTEELYRYAYGEGGMELNPPPPAAQTLLFGARPCDVRGITALDFVFAGRFGDAYWSDKREKTTIAGLSCRRVLPGCFCRAYGYGPTSGEGADLMLTNLGDRYVVEFLTAKGEAVLNAHRDLFGPAGAGDLEEKENRTANLARQFYREVDLRGVREKMDGLFASPYWERLARKCIGCGICTYLCPTCHCFDIVDEPAGPGGGRRLRCWDSCMFADFTLHTSGHNPRPGKKERVRNRFMHKLKYHYDRYGLDGCVGCGRCVAMCPANIDITRVIADVKEVG